MKLKFFPTNAVFGLLLFHADLFLEEAAGPGSGELPGTSSRTCAPPGVPYRTIGGSSSPGSAKVGGHGLEGLEGSATEVYVQGELKIMVVVSSHETT